MFNADQLNERVSALPEAQRRAFAAAVATRQIVSLERVADKKFNVADRLWQGIASSKTPGRDIWVRRISLLPKMVPGCGTVKPCASFVGQAMASLGYAMLCRLSCDSSDAVKAAACAHNAAELAEAHLMRIQEVNLSVAGENIAERELEQQEADLEFLSLGWLDEIRWRSYANPMLTEEEAVTLSAAA